MIAAVTDHGCPCFLEGGIVGHRTFVAFRRAQQDEVVREVGSAENRAYEWHDDIVGQRGDDRAEGPCDNDRDGQVDHIALGNEVLEVLEHDLQSLPRLTAENRSFLPVGRPRHKSLQSLNAQRSVLSM